MNLHEIHKIENAQHKFVQNSWFETLREKQNLS